MSYIYESPDKGNTIYRRNTGTHSSTRTKVEFTYEYYDDNDIKTFIETHFDDRVKKCYSRILNGSLKADFFRYCVVYIKGGLYIDIDISCEKPLSSIFNFDDIHLITTTDNCRNNKNDRIYQAFLGGEANSAVFMNAINHICTCIETQKYKTNMFELSGPTIFSVDQLYHTIQCQGVIEAVGCRSE